MFQYGKSWKKFQTFFEIRKKIKFDAHEKLILKIYKSQKTYKYFRFVISYMFLGRHFFRISEKRL